MPRAQRGFTLIELMVVVAIVGLLAALAITSFRHFQARARQAECKTNLKSVFTAQKSYFGDKQMYLEEFNIIGFAPEMGNRFSYYGGPITGTELRPQTGQVSISNGTDGYCGQFLGQQLITLDESKWGAASWAATLPTAFATRSANPGGQSTLSTSVGVVSSLGACCPQGQCDFLAACQGNIDEDDTTDIWSMSSQGSGGVSSTVTCPIGGGKTTTGAFAAGEPVNECNDAAL